MEQSEGEGEGEGADYGMSSVSFACCRLPSVCHPFVVDEIPPERIRSSVQKKKYPVVRMAAAIRSKKKILVVRPGLSARTAGIMYATTFSSGLS